MVDEVELKVKESYKYDVGRAMARLDNSAFEKLGLSPGDIVSIKGKSEGVAIAWRAKEEDEGRGVVRIDPFIRKNAGVSLDEVVVVKKVEGKTAKQVDLSPSQPISFGQDFIAYVHERILNFPLKKGNSILVEIMGRHLIFTVTNVKPKGVVRIVPETELRVSEKPTEVSAVPEITYEDIGGLVEEIETIREMIEIPMKHPEVFKKLGISPPKGVLLHGPPGCGKTLLAKAVANETESNFFVINGPEVMSKWYGQSEENLRRIFKDAQSKAPSIIFIDEIDALAPSREEVTGEVERRVVSQLLTLMDGLEARGDLVVIAATNIPDKLDPALRRPGRFDRELEIGIPRKEGRKEILQIHTRGMPLEGVNLDQLAEITYGFTGADIAALAKEAAMKALRKLMPDIVKLGDTPLSKEILDKLEVTKDDFYEALKKVHPSAMREVHVEVPNVKWEDVGGLEDVKGELVETVEWPLTYKSLFDEAGINPPKGVLLYGPSGCGKTLLAKAIANGSNANFIPIKGPEIMSKWVGESEKGIRKIFRRARQVAPSIVFFDELDSLAGRRGMNVSSDVTDKIVAQILSEIDGLSDLKDVVIIGTTNRPDLIDPALLRPGRLERLLFVPVPDKDARKEIFKVHTKGMKLAKDVKVGTLAEKTVDYSGADIEAICREAGMQTVRDAIKDKKKKTAEVSMKYFLNAITKMKPSLSEQDKKRWTDTKTKFESKTYV
jgi:transitional endoplasmic reticulum ATPase